VYIYIEIPLYSLIDESCYTSTHHLTNMDESCHASQRQILYIVAITIHCNILQHTPTHCNTLQHTVAALPPYPGSFGVSYFFCTALRTIATLVTPGGGGGGVPKSKSETFFISCLFRFTILVEFSRLSELYVLQCVVVCCSVMQCAAVFGSVLQCFAVCCSVLQCVAACCSLLQCVAV